MSAARPWPKNYRSLLLTVAEDVRYSACLKRVLLVKYKEHSQSFKCSGDKRSCLCYQEFEFSGFPSLRVK